MNRTIGKGKRKEKKLFKNLLTHKDGNRLGRLKSEMLIIKILEEKKVMYKC